MRIPFTIPVTLWIEIGRFGYLTADRRPDAQGRVASETEGARSFGLSSIHARPSFRVRSMAGVCIVRLSQANQRAGRDHAHVHVRSSARSRAISAGTESRDLHRRIGAGELVLNAPAKLVLARVRQIRTR